LVTIDLDGDAMRVGVIGSGVVGRALAKGFPELGDRVKIGSRDPQNARRCLDICDRGYVLDHSKNAHTGPGRELLHDPKVIELHLGTLGAAR
jgi:ornithine cyclodeaminase/alanine dehydrogenase-like protein (mu-crystallin family)